MMFKDFTLLGVLREVLCVGALSNKATTAHRFYLYLVVHVGFCLCEQAPEKVKSIG